ncbi:MAG: hypothetical protein KIT31_29350 [Deltaproteobacteria bacterium]|nr:hypothetical protein [Deltaproteobacteria bacterium]
MSRSLPRVLLLISFALAASAAPASADEVSLEQCTDTVDNDGDGLIDCADPQCAYVCSRLTPVTAPPVASSTATPIASTWILASLAAHGGDFVGLAADLQLGFGGSRLWGIAGVHAAGGTGVASDNRFGVGSAYLGLRTLSRSSRGTATSASIAAGIGYIHEQEGLLEYQYVWPHARLGLGLLRGRGRTPGFGIEVVGAAGYAFEVGPLHFETDYSSFWKSLELQLTFSL